MIHNKLTTTLMLSGLLAAQAQALTPAGTFITNQAAATYDPINGVSKSVSNTVTTRVQAICSVSLSPTGATTQAGIAGETFFFQYTLTNSGNVTRDLPVSATLSGLAPEGKTVIYLDANGNGLIDAGEQPVSSVNLPADASAKLIARVETSSASSQAAKATLNMVTSCGNGEGQVNTQGTISINPPPQLAVTKSFTPSTFRPNETTSVHVTTTNGSTYETREVVLTDPLDKLRAQGLEFVAGSATASVVSGGTTASASATIEYTTDGTTWSTQAPAVVNGIRVRVPSLAAGGVINLDFKMKATEAADRQKLVNIADAVSSGQTVKGEAIADVHYNPAVAIGPMGNPEAPELQPPDTQSKPFAVVGEQVCFDHDLKNTGDVADNFRITVTFPKGSADVTLRDSNGQPLAQPIFLKPGEVSLVRVCYTPQQPGAFEALVTTNGDRGTSNQTKDLLADAGVGRPQLVKTFEASTHDSNGNVVVFKNGDQGNVAIGDTIVYTLTISNPYQRDLTNVVVTDPLPEHVEFVSASDNGTVSGDVGKQSVIWSLGTLKSGETRTLTVKTKVSKKAVDGEVLTNTFGMVSSEFPVGSNAPVSNPVTTPVWTEDIEFKIDKSVTPQKAAYGDLLTYTLVVTNPSKVVAIEDVDVFDKPAPGLQYVPGTSLLGGAPLADPTLLNTQDNQMLWPKVATIPAGGSITITYKMRLTPAAPAGVPLVNVVQAKGFGAGTSRTAIASNLAQAYVTHKEMLNFAPVADLIGTVFVDRNRNGLFDKDIDTPVERARVIMAGGKLTLTDTKGRYHFANVPYGTWALRLDPNTTPYPPLHLPQDGGLSGSQTVHIRGLTSVDFPLAPLGGDIAALRRTTLTIGDVTLEKVISAVRGGYIVTLRVNTPKALSAVNISDPLPTGAVLKEGQNTFTGDLNAGETALTYRFEWTGDDKAVTTDPHMSWRY